MSKIVAFSKQAYKKRILRFVKEGWDDETYYVSDYYGASLESVMCLLNEVINTGMIEQGMIQSSLCD